MKNKEQLHEEREEKEAFLFLKYAPIHHPPILLENDTWELNVKYVMKYVMKYARSICWPQGQRRMKVPGLPLTRIAVL
jgi:hypothetical protein